MSIVQQFRQKYKQINEAVAVNWKNSSRYIKFNELISNKYKLGPFKELKARGSEEYTMKFGPSSNRLISGKYVYLAYNFQDTSREKYGFITHFAITDKDYTSGFSKTTSGYSIDKTKFKPIPKDFKSIKDVMPLIIGAGVDFDNDKSNVELALNSDSSTKADLKVYDINKRFEIMARLVRIVALKSLPGMIITGQGGLGKTYTTMEVIKNLGMLEDEHYKYFQGSKITTLEFYRMLHDEPDSLFIFDDSDSVLDNGDIVNMLKAALDSGSGPRRVSYVSPAVTANNLETKFEFTGQIIFITNKTFKELPQPLVSRSVNANVEMTRKESIQRLEFIVKKESPSDMKEAKFKGLKIIADYEDSHPGRPKDLNMRTLEKIAKVLLADPENGEETADYLLSVS